MENKQKCVGHCLNVCKVHMGEFMFCNNPGCLCHGTKEVNEKDWIKRFDEEFGNCQDYSPETFKDFISSLLTQLVKDIVPKKEIEQIYDGTRDQVAEGHNSCREQLLENAKRWNIDI